jgi:hypothetical protein
MVTRVYLHRRDRWCTLASAEPGGWITTVCGDAIPYGPVLICTSDPGELGCVRCWSTRRVADAEDLDNGAIDVLETSAFEHLSDPHGADLSEGFASNERRKATACQA